MKKTILLSAIFAMTLVGCSKDDTDPVPVVPVVVNPCAITIYHMGGENDNGTFNMMYGPTHETEETYQVSAATYNYYAPRFLAGERCWNGDKP